MGDLNISCVDRSVVTNTIPCPQFIYGEMYGFQGKKHDYLGMWLDLSSEGEVYVFMEV